MASRKFPWAYVVVLAAALGLVYGGFTTFADQRSGTPGTAKVTGCTGGSGKYDTAVRCRGVWTTGGDLVSGNGRVETGPVNGAGHRDVGKTIDVRIHSDHATKPSLGTPILLWALGGPLALLCLWGLWHWWRKDRGSGVASPHVAQDA